MEEKKVCVYVCVCTCMHVTSDCVGSLLEQVEFNFPELFEHLGIVGTFMFS